MFIEGFQLTLRTIDRLFLSLLLTVVFNFPSLAGQSSCIDFYLNLPHPSPAEAAQMWEAKYLDRVSARYQKGWNEWGYRYGANLWKMKQQGSKLTVLLEKFGFEITEYRLNAPTADVFIRNYEMYLNEMGIPEGKRIRPALALLGKQGTLHENQIKMLTPGIDHWPEHPDHWHINYDLRLDPTVLAKNISEGRFPQFSNGIHDVLHFVLFALHPGYAAQLRTKNQLLVQKPFGKDTNLRNIHFLEILALADPNKLDALLPQLSVEKIHDGLTLEDFNSAIEKLTAENLKSKVDYWVNHFSDFLQPFGAGMAEPYERADYSAAIKRMELYQLKQHLTSEPTYYVSEPYSIPYVLFYDGLTHMPDFLRQLSYYSSSKGVDALIRQHVARMEYALWKSATHITLDQWAHDILTHDLDLDSPTMKYIKEVFREDSATYQLFKRKL